MNTMYHHAQKRKARVCDNQTKICRHNVMICRKHWSSFYSYRYWFSCCTWGFCMLRCLTVHMDQVIVETAMAMVVALPWVMNPRRPTLLKPETSLTHILLVSLHETNMSSFSFPLRKLLNQIKLIAMLLYVLCIIDFSRKLESTTCGVPTIAAKGFPTTSTRKKGGTKRNKQH